MKTRLSVMLAAALLSACEMQAQDLEENETNPIHMTTPVPDSYLSAATEQGTIEEFWYDSHDYTSASLPATRKPAYVYLPYGYDPAKQYDIIYLLHGYLFFFLSPGGKP